MDKSLYWAWLTSAKNVGNVRFEQLLAHCGEPEDIYEIARKDVSRLNFLGEETRNVLQKHARDLSIEKIAEILEKHEIRVCTIEDENYPQLLRHIYLPPNVIYIKGAFKGALKLERAISIVGTRDCTALGKTVANAFGKVLAGNNVTVVSGMAIGIDAAAHEGALLSDAECPTIAVLAGGVEKASPSGNEYLYRKIMERGCVISELFPGTPPIPGAFPIRNRIIAGMAHGTLVVEAKLKSGTFHTVNYALDAGRDIFVIPGRITDKQSEGTLSLAKEGAKIVTTPYEIMQEY